MAKLSQPIFVQDSTFTHTYTKTGKYTIVFTVNNSEGLETTSTVTVYVTGEQTLNAPVMSNLEVKSIKQHKATINWTTDVKANSVVYFSKISPVDTSVNSNVSRKALVLNHKIELKKLEANTKYYVVVKSTNKAGTTTSSETSFTTPPITTDTSAPVITGLTGSNSIKVGETETVTVNAYDPKNGTLSYSADWGDTNLITKNAISVSEKPIFVQSATFSHVYSSPGTYTATFTVENSDGKKDSSSMKILVTLLSVDITNPLISEVRTLTGSTTSTISWTTNEPSTSEVFYSTNTPVDVNSSLTPSIISKLLVTKHSLNMSGLSPSTIYHFVIKSADESSNTTISSESSFITNFGL
jgi:PKD repeat protein